MLVPMRITSINAERSHAWRGGVFPELVELAASTRSQVIAVQECPGPEAMAALAQALGMEHYCAASPTGHHTGLLWAPEISADPVGDKYIEDLDEVRPTWHGFASATLHHPRWPSPITVLCAHLVPHSTQQAVSESQFIQGRVRREGRPGIVLGDLNHPPLIGPEPDNWDLIPEHNRASRTILDPADPDRLLWDRRVGLVLHRGRLVDVAAHLHQTTGREDVLEPTGIHGHLRVDQIWVTSGLVGSITGYTRHDPGQVTDHYAITAELDLAGLDPIGRVAYH